MKFLSVCSGIEAASQAWHSLGWEAVAFSEIDSFPSAVLAHRYPNVPNFGDLTKYLTWPDANSLQFDLLCGGTPCQAFSLAGLRKGMADPRGNLALTFLALVERYRPRWVVWENVPGVLSCLSHDAPDPCPPDDPLDMELDGQEVDVEDEYTAEELHAFNCFMAGLSELGYGWAYRILDAQYFGVPQRRRRPFVIGYLGDWRRAAAVLFEPESMLGYPPPSRKPGKGIAAKVGSSAQSGGRSGTDFDPDGDVISQTVTAKWAKGSGGPAGDECQNLVARALTGEGFDAGEDGTGRGTPIIPIAFDCKRAGNTGEDDVSPTLRSMANASSHANAGGQVAVAIQAGATRINPKSGPQGSGIQDDLAYTLEARKEVQAVAFQPGNVSRGAGADPNDEVFPSLNADAGDQHPHVAFAEGSGGEVRLVSGDGSRCAALACGGGKAGQGTPMIASGYAVRRLTPRECERLQGFPDDYTLIPYRGKPADQCPDGPRYKALGNSWAVPCAEWIGRRIDAVEKLFPSTNSIS